MILNMNQLRSFYMAAKLRGISKAAQALMVTPQAITMQIKQLEEAVGIRLLIRDGNAIRLTDTGEMIFKRAERIFSKRRRGKPPRLDGQRIEVWTSNNGIGLWLIQYEKGGTYGRAIDTV